MAASVVSLLLSVLMLYVSVSIPSISCGDQLRYEVEVANFKLARLESLLVESIKDLNFKSIYLNDSQNRIEELTFEIEWLQSELSSLKGESSQAQQRLHQLEEEVRLLWATLRKSNFEFHLLEAKTQDANERLKSVTSKVERLADIVTEQWIQIQQLDQALHIAQMRVSKAKRDAMFARCSFFKWVDKLNEISYPYLFDEKSVIGFYLSQALRDLDTIFSEAKKYHHKLQGFIKHEMERNEYTAPLANKEVVFFVASALFTFPIMGAWILLTS